VQSIADLAAQAETSTLETRRTVDELAALAAALNQTLRRFTLPHAQNGNQDGVPVTRNGGRELDAAPLAR
jgi:hypothetical protein